MYRNFSKLFAQASAACMLLLSFTGCQEVEVGSIQESTFHHDYETSFVKTFGAIDANQTWDFSTYAREQRELAALTRGMAEYVPVAKDDDGYYRVPDDLLDFMQTQVPERQHGTVNPEIVHAFSMEADPGQVFEVIPIYLGQSGINWDLHVVVYDQYEGKVVSDTDVWAKTASGVQFSSNESTWTDVSSSGSGGQGSTTNAKYVRSKSVLLNFSELGVTKPNTTVYFYLDILRGKNKEAEVGTHQTSISEKPQIVAIDCPLEIDNITNNQNYHSMLMACEESNLEAADYDYNDVVFLIVGNLPDVNRPVETTSYVKKRYLIEDLGNTYDFDFNDIVVDVTQKTTQWILINPENGEATVDMTKPITVEQEATVPYLCGTMPLQIKVGDTYFGQVTDPTNLAEAKRQLARTDTDKYGDGTVCTSGTPGIAPNVTKVVTGWDPNKNNVMANIWKISSATADPASSDGVWTSQFPVPGCVPYIIAVDQNVAWMPEGTQIPDEWVEMGDMSTK